MSWKDLQASTIRIAAREVVGECNDYQIMFCAVAGKVISNTPSTIEELSDSDIQKLAEWIMKDYLGDSGKESESEWDTYNRFV